jgi:glutamyl-tRNA reductase
MDARRQEAHKVEGIVAEEVDRYLFEHAARQTAPLLTQLRDTAESVRSAEMERFAKRLASLGPEEREVVESITRGIVAKLMHGPTVALKDAAGSAHGERLASAVRDLFGLH